MHFCEDLHDVTLVRRVQDGDMAVFAQLMLHYQRPLYSVALAMLGDAAEARRATRTTFLRTYAWLSTHDPDYGFFSSTHRLLICDCLDVLSNRPAPQASTLLVVETPEDIRGFRRLTPDEQRRRLRAAMLRLPPECRAVVVLRHLAGLSCEETAIILRVSTDTVWSQSPALGELGNLLNSLGLADPPDNLACEVLSQIEAFARVRA